MSLSDPKAQFRGHIIGEYLANGASDPLHMFGSRLGFSGLEDRMVYYFQLDQIR